MKDKTDIGQSRRDNLVLITATFPFGSTVEGAFILPELRLLAKSFSRVIIVPTQRTGELLYKDLLPDNVEIDTFWADSYIWKYKFLRLPLIFQPSSWKMAAGGPTVTGMKQAGAAKAFATKFDRRMSELGLSADNTLIYCFWFFIGALGLGILSQKKHLNYIVCAHGFDLYTNNTHALREITAANSIRTYAVSEYGRIHLIDNLHSLSEKIGHRTLGCTKMFPEALSSHHSPKDKALTFLTVARSTPGKRLELTMQLLAALAIARPDTTVRWIHVGYGIMDNQLSLTASKYSEIQNFKIELRGQLDNNEVQRIYTETAIDWFILTSESEGCPVSCMEALAYGVPIVACDICGMNEIVTDETGLLLAPNPETEEFVRGIIPYIDSQPRMNLLRQNAFKLWEERFNAEKTRREFVEEIAGF